MAKTNAFAQNWLNHVFLNAAITGIGDAGGLLPSAGTGSLYVSQHTASPGVGGNQTTNEANWTSYARVAVARTGAGWVLAAQTISNVALITFPPCTGGSNVITDWGIGTDSAGAGNLLYTGPMVTAFFDYVAETDDNTVTAPGHTLVVNDPVVFIRMPFDTLPGNIVIGTVYFVKTQVGDVLTISATVGGATFTISSDGSGAIGKIGTLAVSNLITPQFAIGALSVTEV